MCLNVNFGPRVSFMLYNYLDLNPAMMTGENSSVENTLPDNTLPDNTLPDNTLPDNTLPDNTLVEPASVNENSKKKEYPYAELSKFDDLCSSLLLDSLYLGFETHKFMDTLDEFVDEILNSSLKELSSEDLVPAILIFFIRNFLMKKDVEGASVKLMELLKYGNFQGMNQNQEIEKGFREISEKYSQKDLTEREEELLKEHLSRYLMLYFPNAGFEINRTFRYDNIP